MKQLEKQISDVQSALGNLSLCLKLALDDKDQFLKEYGSRLYGFLCSISATTEANEARINDILFKD